MMVHASKLVAVSPIKNCKGPAAFHKLPEGFKKTSSVLQRSNESDFVTRSAALRPKQRPLCGLTYSTLKFMTST